jgi:hypothetical protein
MSRFEIEQYELHVATYEVEALSAADAIRRLFDGDGTPFHGSEYIGICEEVGLALADDPELAEELRRLGVKLRESMVPSIRSVRRIDGGDEPSP